MKIGGIGTAEGFGRTDQTGKKGALDSLLSPGGAATSASVRSRADRSEVSSKEKPESFSETLKKSSAKKSKPVEKRNEKPDMEAVAGASENVSAYSRPVVTDRLESAPASSSSSSDLRTQGANPKTAAVLPQGTNVSSPAAKPMPNAGEVPDLASINAGMVDAVSPVGSTVTVEGGIPEDVLTELMSEMASELGMSADTEQTIRNESMRDFLGKMKSEFGVEPEAIMKAFTNLDAESLNASPESSAQAILSQLDLKPEQLPKAERFYREMLVETGESAFNETLIGVGAGVTLKVLSEQDVAMEKLQKSITGLNDAFAGRTGLNDAPTVAPPQVPASISHGDANFISSEPVLSDKGPNEKKNAGGGAELGAMLAAISSEGLSLASAGSSSSQTSGGEGTLKDGKSPDVPTPLKDILSGTGFSIPMNGEKASVPTMAGTSTSASLAAAMMSQGDQSTAADNAKDIVRHAQVLLKNGGGEMRMELKPEGVGAVHLKVAVKDGQVAIQMLTETDSAKKALEHGIDDLKTSLAQHKLHVDALKIEVGSEMAKQRFEQSQQDANREQARQFAQDFLGQFRQDREGFRQGFTEGFGSRAYNQPRRPVAPEMEQVSSSDSKKSESSRRLNLVA